MTPRQIVVYLVLYLALLATVITLTYFGARWYFARQRAPSTIPVHLSTLAPTPTFTPIFTGKPVEKTSSSTAIEYWLYGTVVAVEQEASEGARLKFVLNDDPTSTQLAVLLTQYDGRYRVYTYRDAFGQGRELRTVGSAGLKLTLDAKVTPPPIGLHVVFLRSNITDQDQQIMDALERANSGTWQDLPVGRTIVADAIGVIDREE